MKYYIDEIYNNVIRLITDDDGQLDELYLETDKFKKIFPPIPIASIHEGMSWQIPENEFVSFRSGNKKSIDREKFKITTKDELQNILDLQQELFHGGQGG